MSFVLNIKVTADTTGVAFEDYDLWTFAWQLQPEKRLIQQYEEQISNFVDQLVSTVNNELAVMQDRLVPLSSEQVGFKLQAVSKRSAITDNVTDLIGGTYKIVIILNYGDGNAVKLKKFEDGISHLYWRSGNEIFPAQCVALTRCFNSVLQESQNSFEYKTESQGNLHVLFDNSFSFITGSDMLDLKFFVLPALITANTRFVVLQGSTYDEISCDLAENSLESLARDCVGLKPMIKLLKIIGSLENWQNFLPSAAFQEAAVIVAKRERAAWDRTSFTTIFRACLKEIHACIVENRILPSADNQKVDLLAALREGTESQNASIAVTSFIQRWVTIPSENLKDRLRQTIVLRDLCRDLPVATR